MKKYIPKKMVSISRYQNYFPTLSVEIKADLTAIFILFVMIQMQEIINIFVHDAHMYIYMKFVKNVP